VLAREGARQETIKPGDEAQRSRPGAEPRSGVPRPGHVTASALLSLQRAAGNRAVTVMLRPPGLQRLKAAEHSSLQRLKAAEFPGFSQGDYNTCGAASIVTALMIWDRERKDPAAPNDLVVTACNALIVRMDSYRTAIKAGWKKVTPDPEKLYTLVMDGLTATRDAARAPGAQLAEADYQTLGVAFYAMHKSSAGGGLSKGEITSLLADLGLDSGKSEAVQSFDDLFTTAVLTGLQPGQVAQALWWARTGPPDDQGNVPLNEHAFLVGRFQRGTWFLSDQGARPPTELEAPDLASLKSAIHVAASTGASPLHVGGLPTQFVVGGWHGVQLLGDRSGVQKAARDIVMKPGDFLGAVDAGWTTRESKIYAWDMVGRAYSFSDAQTLGGTSGIGNGVAIVERPPGLFHVFKTSPVSEANVKETSLDASGSAGGKLDSGYKFYNHAWLLLCWEKGCSAKWVSVY